MGNEIPEITCGCLGKKEIETPLDTVELNRLSYFSSKDEFIYDQQSIAFWGLRPSQAKGRSPIQQGK